MGASISKDYEMPWRPTFELYSSIAWAGSAVASGAITVAGALPPAPFYYIGAFAAAMATAQGYQSWQHRRLKRSLAGKPLTFIDIEELFAQVRKMQKDSKRETLWLGKGFEWGQKHAQRVYEITKRALEPEIMAQAEKRLKQNGIGKTWIHGIEPDEQDIHLDTDQLGGHLLITGTTGSGKTRLFDNLVSQAVARNETVFIVDPKGDKELMLNAFRACVIAGRPEAFINFNPAFPSRSVRIDPLKNWNRSTEVASRIKELIVSDSDNDPFSQFSWMAINNIVQGLVVTGVRPTFKQLRRYIEGGPAPLVARALSSHFDNNVTDWRIALGEKLKKAKDGEAETRILVGYYKDVVEPRHPSTPLTGLIKMFDHDRAHFSKMVTSLEPILAQLTTGELGDLLSPDAENPDDIRPITDSARMINAGQVVYMGLDSLSDSTVGSAIGSIALADLTSVCGDRYNYGVNNRPVNVFVDEASEVCNRSLISLMNKGRGAGFRVCIATQTFPDFVARLGDESRARQVIGNANHTISLRVKDDQTQEFVANPLGETTIRQIMHTQNTTAIDSEKNPTSFSGGYGERLIETEAPLFPAPLLGNLPNLEFIAAISGGRVFKGRIPIITSSLELTLDDQVWVKESEMMDKGI